MSGTGQTTQGRRLLEVHPVQKPTDPTLEASPSKSVTHRAILMGVLSPHIRIQNPLLAADTLASLRLAHALGAVTSASPTTPAAERMLATLHINGLTTIQAHHAGPDESSPNASLPDAWTGIDLTPILKHDDANIPAALVAARVEVHVEGPRPAGDPRPLPVAHDHVDLGNSGTTLRLGTALAALAAQTITLTGDESLRRRPMGPLLDALDRLGASCTAEGLDARPPIRIQGPWKHTETTLDGGVSSQYVSALLIAAHGTPRPLTLTVTGEPASAPYIRLTIDALESLGGQVRETRETDGVHYHVPADAHLESGTLRIPGDWSSAAFPLIAAAITGGRVRLIGLDPESPQGDRVVLDALTRTGCTIEWQTQEQGPPVLELTAPDGPLHAFDMDLHATPDLLPPLGVLAARTRGTSRFTGIAHARIKETDRIAATAAGLRTLGFDAHEEPDALEVTGDPSLPLPEAVIETHADHRILMAFSVLALTGPGPLRMDHPGCYHISYPRFRLDLDALGATSHVVTQTAGTRTRPQKTQEEQR